MNALTQVFVYKDTQEVRTIIEDGKPWFVAKDVCEVLELGDVSKACIRLDNDEKGTNSILTPGGEQSVLVVNEPGLYTLVLGSRKPEAKSFKRWITHEVIPMIRETGSYSAPQQPKSIEDLIILQAQSVKDLKSKVVQLEDKTSVLAHRVDNLDTINLDGDKQQRFNKMIQRYSQQNGYSFSRAWREFVQFFNTAYKTNLELLKTHYATKHGFKTLTTPQYLSCTGRLEDAIRVADKMLNRECDGNGDIQ